VNHAKPTTPHEKDENFGRIEHRGPTGTSQKEHPQRRSAGAPHEFGSPERERREGRGRGGR